VFGPTVRYGVPADPNGAPRGVLSGIRYGEPVTVARPQTRWRRIRSSPWFHLVLAFVVVGLVLGFVAKPYRVPSASMENTLMPGDALLVNRLAYLGSAPRTGDIVVFDADSSWGAQPAENPVKAVLRWVGEVTGFGPTGSHTLVKRVIAGPGQTVSCCSPAGKVVVNGHPLDEPYVLPANDYPFDPKTLGCNTVPRSLRCFASVTVPRDDYLVMGDHRNDSSDSVYACRGSTAAAAHPPASCFRWVKRSEVVGQVSAIVWPIGRWAGF
jgi:signal peptidase I